MTTRHAYQVFIRADVEEVWQAIIDPAFTSRYFFGTAVESDFEPGSGLRYRMADGSIAVEGTIEVFEPPYRLVHSWRCFTTRPSPTSRRVGLSGESNRRETASPGCGCCTATWPARR